MKTSNKILCTAGAAFLLFTIGTYAFLHIKYHRTKAYPQELLQQMTDTRIRTLTSKCTQYEVWSSNININEDRKILTQYLDFPILPTPETVFIHGDTLELRYWAPQRAHIQLPYINNDYLQRDK